MFDSGNYDQRRDFVHAVRFLVTARVLSKIDGHESQFLSRTSADVLYDINRHILTAFLNLSHSPSAMESLRTGEASFVERLGRLTSQSTVGKEDDRSRRIRARLVRALLDDPVLYFDDLDDEERDYRPSQSRLYTVSNNGSHRPGLRKSALKSIAMSG